MGALRWLVLLLLGILILIGLSWSYSLFKGKQNVPQANSFVKIPAELTVVISNRENWNKMISELGVGGTGRCALPSRETFDCAQIKEVTVQHSNSAQPYLLQQNSASAPSFASVNMKINSSKLELTIHADQNKMKGDPRPDWWIGHQVVRALNLITHPDLDSRGLLDLDIQGYKTYQDLDILKVY